MSRHRLRPFPVSSGGPDAVHLCLLVGGQPHPYGCAWASYGEARERGPTTAGRLRKGRHVHRARLLPPSSGLCP